MTTASDHVIALEDLSAADWPPPWTDERIALVLEAFDAIRRTSPPAMLRPIAEDPGEHWRAIADDPGPLLGVGICSASWLDRTLPELLSTAERAPLSGDALIHGDVRSDNLCFRAGRVVVIDWSHAEVANPDLDVAAWLPEPRGRGQARCPRRSCRMRPSSRPGLPGTSAGSPACPRSRTRRTSAPLQRAQSATALPWAARALGLPPPD